MAPSRPFFTAGGELDTTQLLTEAQPLAMLIGAVVAAALVPLLLRLVIVEALGILPVLDVLLTVVTQFVVAVGSGLVLLYVVVRAIDLAAE